MLRRMAQLSKQLMSTLSIENKNWTKARIEQHNRVISEYLHLQKEEQITMNSDAIMRTLNDRLRFIEDVQDSYLNNYQNQKENLAQKLELLKKPALTHN